MYRINTRRPGSSTLAMVAPALTALFMIIVAVTLVSIDATRNGQKLAPQDSSAMQQANASPVRG